MMMSRFRRSSLVAIVGFAALLTASAQAQPILKKTKTKNMTLNFAVQVSAWQERRPQPENIPGFDKWKFDQTAIVFPINRSFATADLQERAVTSKLMFANVEVPDAFKGYLEGYHSGTRLGKWGIENMSGRFMRLTVGLPYRCYETEFDEEASTRAVWPEEWPAEAASTFDRQLFIDHGPGGRQYNMREIDSLVKKWTYPDVKQAHPVIAAKVLAREVVGHVRRITTDGKANNQDGAFEGVGLRDGGVPLMARTGIGNQFELTCLLASVYRRAGIPARTVIGWDARVEDDKFLNRGKKTNELISWVEFALSDPQKKEPVWIPVDIHEMWKDRNGGIFAKDDYYMYAMDHFGNLKDFERVIPFAFQFHPPTTVRSYGSPGFWGWLMLPEAPEGAKQTITFSATSTANRGNDPDRDRDRPDED